MTFISKWSVKNKIVIKDLWEIIDKLKKFLTPKFCFNS